MGFVFKAKDGVQCRCCGAVHAPPGRNGLDVCQTCERKLGKGHKIADIDLLEKIASKLTKQSTLQKRCECLTPNGYQCGGIVNFTRHGKGVCVNHNSAKSVQFVDSAYDGEEDLVEIIVRSVLKASPRLQKRIVAILNENVGESV